MKRDAGIHRLGVQLHESLAESLLRSSVNSCTLSHVSKKDFRFFFATSPITL